MYVCDALSNERTWPIKFVTCDSLWWVQQFFVWFVMRLAIFFVNHKHKLRYDTDPLLWRNSIMAMFVFCITLCTTGYVCVCVWPPVERGYPLTQYQSQGKFLPPNACDVIPSSDSAHQPLPGEMLADGCPLGNVHGTATFSSRLLESRPAHHSVTLRFCLGHLPFLPFQISKESDTRSQCNYAQKTPILTQTKLGKAFETISKTIAWCKGCKSLDRGRSSETSTGSVWEWQIGPRAPWILTQFYLVLCCGNGKV